MGLRRTPDAGPCAYVDRDSPKHRVASVIGFLKGPLQRRSLARRLNSDGPTHQSTHSVSNCRAYKTHGVSRITYMFRFDALSRPIYVVSRYFPPIAATANITLNYDHLELLEKGPVCSALQDRLERLATWRPEQVEDCRLPDIG